MKLTQLLRNGLGATFLGAALNSCGDVHHNYYVNNADNDVKKGPYSCETYCANALYCYQNTPPFAEECASTDDCTYARCMRQCVEEAELERRAPEWIQCVSAASCEDFLLNGVCDEYKPVI